MRDNCYAYSMRARRKKQQISFGKEARPVGGEGDTFYVSIEEACMFTRKKKETQGAGSNTELRGSASCAGSDSRSQSLGSEMAVKTEDTSATALKDKLRI